MATVQPKGENLRKAVKWITEERQYGSSKSQAELLEEACSKYNLSPQDAEFLTRTLSQKSEL